MENYVVFMSAILLAVFVDIQATTESIASTCCNEFENGDICQRYLEEQIKERLNLLIKEKIEEKEKNKEFWEDKKEIYKNEFEERELLVQEKESEINDKTDESIFQTIHKLERNLQSQRSSLENTTRSELNVKLKQLKRDIHNMTTRALTNTESYLTEFKQNLSRQQSESTIAFSAMLSKNGNANGNLVIFDEVGLNIGNGYDGTNGMFVAPSDGLYRFTCSFLVANGYVNIQLLKNGKEISRSYASEGKYENTGLLLSTIGLKEGDQITVNLMPNETYVTGILRADYYSVFSGFMITSTV